MQNTFRHLAAKKIKQIKASNRHNTMHKRHQYNINQIKKILQHNNLTVAKADKTTAIVIMDKEVLTQKIDTFIQENNIMMLSKDPTESYQKLLQRAMQKCEDLVEKNTRRSPTDKNTKHTQMTYTCGHILRNNTKSTNANQREE